MTILIDGAVGTELERRGARMDAPLWSAHALLDDPALVETIHLDYLRAGAQLLTTNTFRTHARNLAAGGDALAERARELTILAVTLARAARDRHARERGDALRARVAGSISPLEDCYEPDRSPVRARALPEHRAMAEDLVAGGCDLLLIETMGRVDEACAAVDACDGLARPVWLSVVCRADGRLIGGEPLDALARALARRPVRALLVNCTDL
ncbi:MAG: homocysteine S-methyltransferase family protein, partial [Myxococcales bacterium]|nr:homocysteine S-methyltransferase family protein [Myxococcales bacterium]